ncbi:SseB family protein [Gammaproteobacteria bacterium AB-CW1]|uniref:SseB family protein n=1 Tax=Natronospira elongata TaxID=3110268 RepID=A0AAP6JED8_9GAMM|nr:SseB family protein [Gammaproteobacteria bacterium AB-CW1]
MSEQEKAAGQEDFEARNELEFLIQAGRDGKVSLGTIFQCLLRSPLYMVMNQPVQPGDRLNDVQGLMVTDKEGGQLLTVFTAEERTEDFCRKQEGFEHPTRFPAPILLDNMRDDMGLVINPGLTVGIQVTAKGVRSLKREFGQGWLQNIPAPEADEGQGGSEPQSH